MMKFLAVLVCACSFQASASTMASRTVDLRRHVQGHFWLLSDPQVLSVEAQLIGASEAVVDQIDSLNERQDYTCQMKYRQIPGFTSGGFMEVLIYEIQSCQGRPAAGQ